MLGSLLILTDGQLDGQKTKHLDLTCYIGLDKNGNQVIIFLISPRRYVL